MLSPIAKEERRDGFKVNMGTNTLLTYASAFFDGLELYEDIKHGHYYRVFLKQSILGFLRHETKDTALAVYRAFFDSYRIVLGEGASNCFIDLLDALQNYEEHVARLIRQRRDHYIHSVNVFILGLCVYAKNERFKSVFTKACMDKSEYPFSYDTKHEEFFYRWGLTSLFHDIAYPLEIAGRIVSEFADYIADADGKNAKFNARISFGNFEKINRIVEVEYKSSFTACFTERFGSSAGIDLFKPIDLLAYRIHTALGVPLQAVKDRLDNFSDTMARYGSIDHGYYSAIIVLKWYGYLIQSAAYRPEHFFWPVLDSASAIQLHNFYPSVLQKDPFRLGPLRPELHPLAFLLILCDELQKWNREAYGKEGRLHPRAARCRFQINDERLQATYICHKGSLPAGFTREKKKLLSRVLDINALFPVFTVHSRTVEKALPNVSKPITPRPLLRDLERLAKAIHTFYNRKQLELYPDKSLKYPDYDTLPETLKYSNLRQAMDIPEKLHRIGLRMCPVEETADMIKAIPEKSLEALAEEEHKAWMEERLAGGWALRQGAQLDPVSKTSPYLVPYIQLPEQVKEMDREAVRNIPALLGMIGMAVIPEN